MSYRERVRRKKLQNESFSLWMDMLYRLSLANHVSACYSIYMYGFYAYLGIEHIHVFGFGCIPYILK